MEIKPNKINRYNKPAFGLIIGLLAPLVCFFIYFLILSFQNDGVTFKEFINTLNQNHVLIPVLSLCVLPNLIFFFIFKKRDYWYAIKGIVTSVFIYTIIVLILKFI